MHNIEKHTGGNSGNSYFKMYYFLGGESMTKIASQTRCTVCLQYDS